MRKEEKSKYLCELRIKERVRWSLERPIKEEGKIKSKQEKKAKQMFIGGKGIKESMKN